MPLEEVVSIFVLTTVIILVPAWRRYYFFPKAYSLKISGYSQRIEFYDFLKGISIIAVIVIHVGYFCNIYDNPASNSLFIIMSNNLSRFCIPIFFICSGILLKPWKEVDDKADFYKKKFLRIFLPYILLVTLMAVYYNIPFFLYIFFLANGKALVPFYFIIVLLQLYLIYPFLNKYRKSKYFLLITFLISFFSTLFFDPVTIFGAVLFVKFLFFFAYGMYMRNYFLNQEKLKKEELILWLILAVIYIFISIILPQSYFNFRLFYGLAIFNILYYYRETLAKRFSFLYKILASIGFYSLWIFLFHFVIEREMYNLVASWQNNFYPKSAIYFSFILIVSLTLLFSYFLSRVMAFFYVKILKSFDLS